jgi:hypothetical protein
LFFSYETLRALENLGFFTIQPGDEYRFRRIHELITAWRISVGNQKKKRIELYVKPDKPLVTENSWWEGAKDKLESKEDFQLSVSGSVAATLYGIKTTRDLSVLLHVFQNLQDEVLSPQRRLLGMSQIVAEETTEHKVNNKFRLNRFKSNR